MRRDKEKFLIIGASGCIGKSIMEKMLREGHKVIATYNTCKIQNSELLEAVHCNLLQHNYDNLIKKEVNHIIYCVGQSCFHDLYKASHDEFLTQCDLNVYIPLEIIRRYMATENQIKTITFISSDSGISPTINSSFYGLSKGMMIILAQVLSNDLIEREVRVNVIAPSLTYSNMAQELCRRRGGTIEEEEDNRYDGRLILPEEIADMCYMLTRNEFRHINGQVIEIKSEIKK